MKKYTSFARFQLRKDLPEAEQQKLRDSLAAYRRVIVTVTEQRLAPYQSFFAKFAPESPVIYVFYTPAKSMLQIQRAVSAAEAVVLAHALVTTFRNVWLIYFSVKQRQMEDCRPVLADCFLPVRVLRLLRILLSTLYPKNME